MKFNKLSWCMGLLFIASTCLAQMYTVTDLGTVDIRDNGSSTAMGINESGQVVGESSSTENGSNVHAFRTAPNKPINPATDDFGPASSAAAINSSGQVVGNFLSSNSGTRHAFRTAPNQRLNPATDDLGTLHLDTGQSDSSWAHGINDSGQVVGESYGMWTVHAFRTDPNKPINPDTDDIGKFPGDFVIAKLGLSTPPAR
jgi:probable HAF family extracellular repeat protein